MFNRIMLQKLLSVVKYVMGKSFVWMSLLILLSSTVLAGMVGSPAVTKGATYAASASSESDGTIFTIRPTADGSLMDNIGTYEDWDDSPAHNGDLDYVVTHTQLGLSPVGDGTFSEWDGTTATYQDWDDWPADNGDLDYLVTPPQLVLRPNADGTFSEWTGTPNGDYRDWAEETPDGDTSCFNTTIDDARQSSTMEDHTSETWDIANVVVTLVAKALGEMTARARPMLYIAGTEYVGSQPYLHTIYEEFSSSWQSNPATGTAWTWSDIDALEAGVMSDRLSGWLTVTQLYVSVTEKAKQSSTMEDHTSETWDIANVVVAAVARTDSAARVQLMLVIGGTEYLGEAQYLTTTYSGYISQWGLNPDTGLGWTWSDIDALEAGAVPSDILEPGEIRVTQLYVLVNPYMEQSSDLQDVVGATATISTVRVIAYARQTLAENFILVPIVVIGGNMHPFRINYVLTASYSEYQGDWRTNPETGLDWTWSDINALEAGVLIGFPPEFAGEVRITQLYVEVWCSLVHVTPPSVSADPLETFEVNVTGRHMFKLFTWEFLLTFDPNVLEVLEPQMTGEGYEFYIWFWDNVAGYVSVTGGPPVGIKEGITGTVNWATLIFNVKTQGYADLHMQSATTAYEQYDTVIEEIPHDLEDGYITTLPGDIYGDGIVDLFDALTLRAAFGTHPQEPDWNPRADLCYEDPSKDIVDVFDAAIIMINYWKTY